MRQFCSWPQRCPNFFIHEIMLTDGSFRKQITNEEVVFEDGFIRIPDRPGLGIDVNLDEVLKRPYTPRNLRPLYRSCHGYPAERRHCLLF